MQFELSSARVSNREKPLIFCIVEGKRLFEILHVSDQTIRRMCDAGKFPDATRTEGGHWRIPKQYFNVSLDQAREMKNELAQVRKKAQEGGEVDEFHL
ncbi:helix-turn-helix domain-containing protein [Sporosarcina sp. OR05]|uniref:helix-turn-helix domain-containing protein n=1 Tax=Sporosarcina sp. OR05 TaxID=2969819 RepID=UPI00352BAB5F